MWGGWFDADEYMELMNQTLNIARTSLEFSAKSCAEVAVFIDEKAMLKRDATEEAYNFRHALGLMGAAYDIYLVNDFVAVQDKYKLCVFIVPEKTDLMTEAINSCPCKKVVITKKNCSLDASHLRVILKNAGVSLRASEDAVVYENESYIFIGGNTAPLVYDGEVTLLLDGIGRLYKKNN